MRDVREVRLRELLPPSLVNDPDVLAAAEAIDAELLKVTEAIPNISVIPRLIRREIVDERLVDILAWQFHVDFFDPDVPLPIEVRRELAANSLDWHTRKGTPSVVEEIVTTVFADAEVTEWFEYGGRPYSFRIETAITDVTARKIGHLITAIFSVKNTRSWLDGIDIVWPADNNVRVGMALSQEIETAVDMKVQEIEIDASEAYFGTFILVNPVAFAILEV